MSSPATNKEKYGGLLHYKRYEICNKKGVTIHIYSVKYNKNNDFGQRIK
jgi:hypothetical protein